MSENDPPMSANKITNWKLAKKIKPIKAKPIVSLLVDKSVISKFLVDTLEAKEPLGKNSIICIGESGDVWQQEPKKLLKKYKVNAIDDDGWLICEPYPDNAVDCYQVDFSINTYSGEHYLEAKWGESYGKEGCIQNLLVVIGF